ncbi:MAG: hypothetical protein AMXMBFR34_07940 [Myxococcaceae bacterium]
MKRLVLSFLFLAGCVQTTGGRLVEFSAQASGDPAVVSGGPLSFTSPSGFDVTLTRAHLFAGALYLSQQNPQSYALEASCLQPGVYSGEVRGAVRVDALSPTPAAFPVSGNGTDAQTLSAELWLTGGDVEADVDTTVVLDVAGTATRGPDSYPFEGAFTISQNRVTPPRNPALPGSNPLCQQRIVAPIPFDAQLAEGGTLSLLVDPRAWFASVDFSTLTKVSDTPLLYRFTDDSSSSAQADKALYNGLRAAVGPYRFTLAP